jgi:predicted transcriptional regulator of viral defense system
MKKRIEWDILRRFSAKEKQSFTFEDVVKEFKAIDRVYLIKVLSRMVKDGLLIRLERGVYNIVPLNESAINYIPDWHLVARAIMEGKDYYIGYYSAMQIHGLITQPSLTEIIVTKVQIKPSIVFIKNVKFQFVHHIENRFGGYSDVWISNHEKVKCSDLEKTLTDALTKPHYAGGIVEVAKAIYETRSKVSIDKLINYLTGNDSYAAKKRYLYLCDLLDISTAYHHGMKAYLGTGISLLDTSGSDEGHILSEFGLKINIDEETIKDSIFT